jgi:uncharacterized protein YjbJ (UPF0337 family)
MGIGDKVRHKKAEAAGKAKEKPGKATNDPGRAGEGQAIQRSANLKQAGERVRDAFEK